MRTVGLWTLMLLVGIATCSAAGSRIFEGGEIVPYETKDGTFIYVSVSFSLSLNIGLSADLDEDIERDFVTVMKTNAIGIVGSKVSGFFLSRLGEYSLSQIEHAARSNGGDPIVEELDKMLSAEESLNEVTIHEIHVTYERMEG